MAATGMHSLAGLLVFTGMCVAGLTACSTLDPFPNTEEHIVARDESLYSIAWRYELDFRDLAEWNGISKPYKLYPGQMLVLHPFGGGPKRRPIVQPESQPEAPRAPPKLTTRAVENKPEQTARAVKPSPEPTIKPIQTSQKPATSSPDGKAGSAAPAGANTAGTGAAGATTISKPPTKIAKAEPPRAPPAANKPKPRPIIDRPVRTRNGWAWPTAGKPSKTYKDTGTGLTIPGQIGQSVHAARKGKVVYAGSGLKGYGLLIIIKHSDEYLTAYGYNDRILVAQGESVKAGQRIATMGLGPENNSQLHFELRRNGRPVDPMRVLPSPG
ncbi:MAG: peptidoglycan DD-metalloendopeptidase family protein [Salinisphaeraceae bacterium]|nr:peptidoglycan DD-metalloendopeptidase family protein [Salinisphaeraceae bacterium]